MAERAGIFEKPRFGLEATASPGSPVQATKVLQTLTVGVTPQLPRNPIKAQGRKVAVGVTGAKQWTDLTFDANDGSAYTDASYLCEAALRTSTVAAISGVPTASRLTYLQSNSEPDPMATYTIDLGSSAGSGRVPGVFLSDISFQFTPKSVKVSAKGMGKRYDENIALFTPSDVPLIPMEPDSVSVYVASTLSGLNDAGARLKRCVSSSYSQSGKQGSLMTLDDSEGSFSCSLEKGYEQAAQIVVMQDSAGIGIMNRMRTKDLFYVRIEAIGIDIVSGTPYRLRITMVCFVSKTQRGDVDDMYAGTYDLTPVEKADAFGSGKTGSVLVEIDVPTAFATSLTTVGTAIAGYNSGVAVASQQNPI